MIATLTASRRARSRLSHNLEVDALVLVVFRRLESFPGSDVFSLF